jgi:hypothetical protein
VYLKEWQLEFKNIEKLVVMMNSRFGQMACWVVVRRGPVYKLRAL